MTIFEKSNPTVAFTKMVIFWLIFAFIFVCKFELRSLYTAPTIDAATPPGLPLTPLPPPQLCHHNLSALAATSLAPLLHLREPQVVANNPFWQCTEPKRHMDRFFFVHFFFKLTNSSLLGSYHHGSTRCIPYLHHCLPR